MKNKFFHLLICIILLNNCYKKKNISLAKNFYDQSLLESEEKNYKKALQLVDKSIAISATPQAKALKATLLYQIKEFSESLTIFKEIINDKNTPDMLKADIMNNYACTLLSLNQKEEAREIWLQLINHKSYLSPEVAWFNLGLLDFWQALNENNNTEKLKRAQKYFSKAVEISKEYVDAFFYLAATLLHLKEYENAKKIIIKLLIIEPEHEAANFLLTEINNQLHEHLNKSVMN